MRTALAKLILYGSALLPLRVAHILGTLCGYALYLIPNQHRRISAINIGLCFPNEPAAQRKRLLRQSLIELGKTIFETGAIWCWSREKVLGLVKQVSGYELIDQALQDKHGIIVLTPHLGSWEMMGLYCSVRFKITSLYRPPKQQALEPVVRAARERVGASLVPTDASGVRALFHALKHNEGIGILPDQDPGESGSAFAPFFGHPTRSMTLVARLAQKSQARVIFCYAQRLPHGQGFHLHYLAAPETIDAKDTQVAVNALNAGVENCVRRCPEQYQWSYKRFKASPPGQTRPY